VRESLEGGRTCLSAAAAGAVFDEAVRQARGAGELQAIASVIDWPGYRRRLRQRIADWTETEHRLKGPAPEDPVAASEWAVFVRYRRLLVQLGAEDETGFALWVARRLMPPPAPLSVFDQVTFLDWEAPTRAHWRILEHVLRRARSIRITLAYEPEPSASPVYETTALVRARLLKLGFDEEPIQPEIWRPAGLRAVEQSLFRQETLGHPEISVTKGVTIWGAPAGEGLGRLLAREVRRLLQAGNQPEEILILVREWSEQADVAFEVMQDWGLPVSTQPSRPLGADPAVAALLLAIGLPVQDWDTERLIRVLRNGQVRPAGPATDPLSMASAASVIQRTRVYRGRESLLRRLEDMAADKKASSDQVRRTTAAYKLVSRVFALLAPLDRPRSYVEQLDQLFKVADDLGFDCREAFGLDQLRDALEDKGDVLDRLGQGETFWTWSTFVQEVESMVLELKAAAPAPRPGSVRMAAVDEVVGARARFVILADLVEGTFPTRDAVEAYTTLRPGVPPSAATRQALSREMLRFLSVLGSADSGVILIYPTTDAKGQELLRAGFLDELLELLTPEAAALCHQAFGRFDPTLIESPDLAGAPGDHRILAAALARWRGDLAPMAELAARPEHHPILEGTAAALHSLSRRQRGTPFGEYDGLLGEGETVLKIGDTFATDYRFSASQLETYIACPFQFFCKYVMKLEPVERRDELDEDYTVRGSRIHDILEQIEQMKQESQEDRSLETLAKIVVESVLKRARADASNIELGLLEIESRRLIQTLQRYHEQHRHYASDPESRPIPHLFELEFGGENARHGYLELSRGSKLVRLSGKIDRIDLVETPQGRGFRVIDYKSGAGPSPTEVIKARLLQLPLYAMAVERIILREEAVSLRDVGYWALRKEGYRPIVFEEWEAVQSALETYVAELVGRLRQGIFVVDSQVDGCESFCDFRAICRIRQARLASKRHDRVLAPELSTHQAKGQRKPRGTVAEPGKREVSEPPSAAGDET
jgi:RecB family exonuclease